MDEAQSTNYLFKSKRSESVFVLVYVDDLLIVGNRIDVAKVNIQLVNHFTTTDLGPCSHFLHLPVHCSDEGTFLSQLPFSDNISELAGLSIVKPAPILLPFLHALYEKKVPLTDIHETKKRIVAYRSLLGSLLYLPTRTRQDIDTVVSLLEKFQEALLVRDCEAIDHVVPYIKGTTDMGILLPRRRDIPNLKVWFCCRLGA